MLLRRALISKRMETRLLAVVIGQVAEVVFSESVGVVSGPSAKRWADSLRKSVGLSGLAEGLAWSVGVRMTGRIIQKGPFGRATRQAFTGSPAPSATALLSSLFGGDGLEHNTGFGEKVISGLSEMVPGIGTVREVAMLDGNLLFHEPLHYLKSVQEGVERCADRVAGGSGRSDIGCRGCFQGRESQDPGASGSAAGLNSGQSAENSQGHEGLSRGSNSLFSID